MMGNTRRGSQLEARIDHTVTTVLVFVTHQEVDTPRSLHCSCPAPNLHKHSLSRKLRHRDGVCKVGGVPQYKGSLYTTSCFKTA